MKKKYRNVFDELNRLLTESGKELEKQRALFTLSYIFSYFQDDFYAISEMARDRTWIAEKDIVKVVIDSVESGFEVSCSLPSVFVEEKEVVKGFAFNEIVPYDGFLDMDFPFGSLFKNVLSKRISKYVEHFYRKKKKKIPNLEFYT